MDNIPKMLSIKEASKKTGMSYDAIRNLCLQNRIVYIRTGAKYLINMDKFVEFLNKGEKGATE